MKSSTSSHSVCIFSVKYTLWPAAVRLPANSALWKITADILLHRSGLLLFRYIYGTINQLRAMNVLNRCWHRFIQWLHVEIMFASFRCKHSCNERLQAWGTCFVSGMYKDTTVQKEAIMSGACVGWAHASLLCFVSIVCGITSGRKHEGKNTHSGAQDTEWL